jgi:hypothetical protein
LKIKNKKKVEIIEGLLRVKFEARWISLGLSVMFAALLSISCFLMLVSIGDDILNF